MWSSGKIFNFVGGAREALPHLESLPQSYLGSHGNALGLDR